MYLCHIFQQPGSELVNSMVFFVPIFENTTNLLQIEKELFILDRKALFLLPSPALEGVDINFTIRQELEKLPAKF